MKEGSQAAMNILRTLAPLGVLALLLGACASIARSPEEEEGDHLFRLGIYPRAYQSYLEAEKLRPGDADLHRKLRIAKVAAFLALGREAVFQDQLPEAERWFRRVLAEVPGNAEGQAWLGKVRRKEAERLTHEATITASRGDRAQGMRLARQALALESGFPHAQALLESLEAEEARSVARGAALLADGLHALQEATDMNRMQVAWHHISAAKELSGETFTHGYLLEELRSRMSQRAVAEVEALLQADQYAAALFEVRLALTLFPGSPVLADYLARTLREVKADELADRAHDLLSRGDPAQARRLLEEAAATSGERMGLFKAALAEVEEARLAMAYEEAMGLEARGELEAALARLKDLVRDHPNYRDLMARTRELEAGLAEASRLLAEAKVHLAEGRREEAEKRLRDLFLYFPWHREGLHLAELVRKAAKPQEEERASQTEAPLPR